MDETEKPSDSELAIRAAWDAGRFDVAATLAIETYGGELIGYLAALMRDAVETDDLFGTVSEDLWRALPTFRWECSVRTYAYTIARNAWRRHLRDPRRRIAHAPASQLEEVVARVRTTTAIHLRTETKDKLDALRAQLDPDDQTLLILRVNRKLAWRDIARVMADDDDDLDRRAAALRKRFERLKVELREKLG